MAGRKPSAQILEDMPFHHRQWFMQRVAWAIAVLVVVLALFGLFGDGPLSHAHAATATFRVDYDRLIRRDNPVPLDIDVKASQGNEVSVVLSADYVQAFRLDSVLPYPDHMYATASEVVFVFRSAAPGTPLHITILQAALNPGSVHGQIRMADAEVAINQFVYP